MDPVNPRVQFWQDLSAKMQQFQEEGHEIILMLDANSDFDDVQFLQMIIKHNLLDLHLNLTSLTPPPESYRRGKKVRLHPWVFGYFPGSSKGWWDHGL